MCRSRRSARTSSIRIWSPTGSTRYRSGWTPLVTRLWSEGADSAAPPGELAGFARELGSISSAANASAAVRLPTPRGPWKRYACAGPSTSAARRRRFASCCSGKLSNPSMHDLRELRGRERRVEREDPLGKELGELPVGAVDGCSEVVPL